MKEHTEERNWAKSTSITVVSLLRLCVCVWRGGEVCSSMHLRHACSVQGFEDGPHGSPRGPSTKPTKKQRGGKGKRAPLSYYFFFCYLTSLMGHCPLCRWVWESLDYYFTQARDSDKTKTTAHRFSVREHRRQRRAEHGWCTRLHLVPQRKRTPVGVGGDRLRDRHVYFLPHDTKPIAITHSRKKRDQRTKKTSDAEPKQKGLVPSARRLPSMLVTCRMLPCAYAAEKPRTHHTASPLPGGSEVPPLRGAGPFGNGAVCRNCGLKATLPRHKGEKRQHAAHSAKPGKSVYVLESVVASAVTTTEGGLFVTHRLLDELMA